MMQLNSSPCQTYISRTLRTNNTDCSQQSGQDSTVIFNSIYEPHKNLPENKPAPQSEISRQPRTEGPLQRSRDYQQNGLGKWTICDKQRIEFKIYSFYLDSLQSSALLSLPIYKIIEVMQQEKVISTELFAPVELTLILGYSLNDILCYESYI